MKKVGIIGTSGRGVLGKKLNKDIFEKMVNKTEEIIENQLHLEWRDIVLVSGGAAWAGSFHSFHFQEILFNSFCFQFHH
jgi:hypothetical protein